MKHANAAERMTKNYMLVPDTISTLLVSYRLINSEFLFAVRVNNAGYPTGIVSKNGRELLVIAHISDSLNHILMDNNVWEQLEEDDLAAIIVVDNQKLPCGIITADILREYQHKEFTPTLISLGDSEEHNDTNEETPTSTIKMYIDCATCGTPNILLGEYIAGVTWCSNTEGGKHLLEKTPERVLFSAYVHPEAPINQPNIFYVYAHTEALTKDVEADVLKGTYAELSQERSKPYRSNQHLKPGTRLTLTPESDQLTIEPVTITKTWNGKWVRFSFEFQPTSDLVNKPVSFRISIQTHHIEISHIDCTIQIVPHLDSANATPQKIQTAFLYQKIFVSYSRTDRDIIDQYFKSQQALGNDVWIDTINIRPGEEWREAIQTAIRDADVFQLFWSKQAANSVEVRKEWKYAFQTRCTNYDCHGFIRPIYWEDEMPECPAELSHLNFKYVKFSHIPLD